MAEFCHTTQRFSARQRVELLQTKNVTAKGGNKESMLVADAKDYME
jgi:hypothetical protein